MEKNKLYLQVLDKNHECGREKRKNNEEGGKKEICLEGIDEMHFGRSYHVTTVSTCSSAIAAWTVKGQIAFSEVPPICCHGEFANNNCCLVNR